MTHTTKMSVRRGAGVWFALQKGIVRDRMDTRTSEISFLTGATNLSTLQLQKSKRLFYVSSIQDICSQQFDEKTRIDEDSSNEAWLIS